MVSGGWRSLWRRMARILNGANLGGVLGENLGAFVSIIQIDLVNNHIGGAIPSTFPPTIKILTLSGNQLVGTIEGFEVRELIVDVQNCLQAFVGVVDDLDAIVIAFRGTQETSFDCGICYSFSYWLC